MLKHAFVSSCLKLGISVNKKAAASDIRDLLATIHPIDAGIPLIRIGNDDDGGYLVPDDLGGIVGCFSPGVDNRATFEQFFVDRGIPCYLADASVDGPPIQSDLVKFEKKFVGVVDDDRTLNLDTWVAANAPPTGDLLLQMDIEGAEWPVLLSCPIATLRRFRLIVIELHDLERLFDKHAFPIIKSVFEKLLSEFDVVHNHPNNYGHFVRADEITVPRAVEMTFLRKDRVKSRAYVDRFPHRLDVKNAAHLADVVLPAQWYRS